MSEKKRQPVFVLQITRGLIRDQAMRRATMFIVVLVAALMVFAGSVLLNSVLTTDNPWLLFGYWGVVAWLTILSILLALFDILLVRRQMRAERRRLRSELLGNDSDHE